MNSSAAVTAVGFAALFGLALASTQQSRPPSEEATKREIKAAFDQYYEWFSAARADLVAERVYQAPIQFLQPNGFFIAPSQDSIRPGLEAMFKPMIAGGYSRTEMPSPSICVLNESAGIVSGRYTRSSNEVPS